MPSDNILFILKFAYISFLYIFLIQIIAVILSNRQFPQKTEKRKKYIHYLEILTGTEITGSGGKNIYPLTQSITIGRDASNDIQISDAMVSGNHTSLYFSGETFVIEDINSRNGTFVNGERINSPVSLSNDDIISIGMVKMKFRGGS